MKNILAVAFLFVSCSVLARPEYICKMNHNDSVNQVDTTTGNKLYSKQKGLDVYSKEIEPGYIIAIIVDPKDLNNATQVQFHDELPQSIIYGKCKIKG